MGCKRRSSTLDHIYVYNHYIQIHSASPDQGNTQYMPNCTTNAVCTTVLLYLYAYECKGGNAHRQWSRWCEEWKETRYNGLVERGKIKQFCKVRQHSNTELLQWMREEKHNHTIVCASVWATGLHYKPKAALSHSLYSPCMCAHELVWVCLNACVNARWDHIVLELCIGRMFSHNKLTHVHAHTCSRLTQ